MSDQLQQGKTRIMDEFDIEELSGVDVPAQGPAVFEIIKADPDPHAEGREGLAASPDEGPPPTPSSGAPLSPHPEKEFAMSDDLSKALERIEALEAQNADLRKVAVLAKMSDAEKAYTADMDDDDRAAFMAKTPEQRKALMDKATEMAKAADPLVYTADDGTEYHKSAGDTAIRLAKQADESARRVADLEKAAADTELTKRAEAQLAHLPKSLDVRKAVLRAVESIEDTSVRTEGLELLKAADATYAAAFGVKGHNQVPDLEKAGGAKGAQAKLDRLAKAHATENGVDFYVAYDAVSKSNPELLAKALS